MLPYSLLFSLIPLLLPTSTLASVSVYTTITAPGSTPTRVCSGANACDEVLAPLVPLPAPGQMSQSVPIQLLSGGMNGLGTPVKGDFMGFSIELSIVNQISTFFSFLTTFNLTVICSW